MELTNRTILITGGTSGIGFALAKKFIVMNNKVIICGRNQNKLEDAKEYLPALETVSCDINIQKDINALVSFLSGKYPQLDTLINNAGIQQQMDLTSDKTTDREIEIEISTNLTSHINVTHRLYSLLSSNIDPAIVFIGSALALVPKYEAPVYSAAKAGLHSYIQSLRCQTKNDNTHVVEIFPDVVDTPMTHHRNNEIKMGSDAFASQAITQIAKNNTEIFIGRTKALKLIHRIYPRLALRIMNKTNTA